MKNFDKETFILETQTQYYDCLKGNAEKLCVAIAEPPDPQELIQRLADDLEILVNDFANTGGYKPCTTQVGTN